MKQKVHEMSRWAYRGIWGVMTGWFRLPQEPPQLPVAPGDFCETFQPSRGFLNYLRLQWALGAVTTIVLTLTGIGGISLENFLAGLIAGPILIGFEVLAFAFAFLALHLRYDTTWYVVTARSLRIRRGIWVIHETTITFENVQNVSVSQGPLQRFFGIANVLVETAGGGGDSHEKGQGPGQAHKGLIEGVAHAHEVRELLMAQVRRTKTTGLGDEPHPVRRGPSGRWTPEHLSVLREIRDAIGS